MIIKELLTIFGPVIGNVIEKWVPDTAKRDEIEREIKLALLEQVDGVETLRADIVKAEASSEHWLAATWRPLLMLVAIAIIAVNYLIFPLIGIFYPEIKEHMLLLPDQLWTLLQIGVGGYVAGRTTEKIAERYYN